VSSKAPTTPARAAIPGRTTSWARPGPVTPGFNGSTSVVYDQPPNTSNQAWEASHAPDHKPPRLIDVILRVGTDGRMQCAGASLMKVGDATDAHDLIDNYRLSCCARQMYLCPKGNARVPIGAHSQRARVPSVSYAQRGYALTRRVSGKRGKARCPRMIRSGACSAGIELTVA
jgi:hypothetical protein